MSNVTIGIVAVSAVIVGLALTGKLPNLLHKIQETQVEADASPIMQQPQIRRATGRVVTDDTPDYDSNHLEQIISETDPQPHYEQHNTSTKSVHYAETTNKANKYMKCNLNYSFFDEIFSNTKCE